ncbi:nucleoside-diphosphate kinase [Microgenomates group bacterium RBG_16_45_19]|nr:MAG: nucleoside-diphosphate kinase [Microgenomates group bacterium RBG_16_45_19]
MNLEQAVVLIKPDGLQRGLVGEIISRFEQKGLKLAAMKMTYLNDTLLDEWYAHHKDKPFFPQLKSFMQKSPVVAMLWEGIECVDAVRKLTGITKSRAAEAGSIRGDLGMSQQLNLIHASDSVAMADKERDLIFKPEEIFHYQKDIELFIYSEAERA